MYIFAVIRNEKKYMDSCTACSYSDKNSTKHAQVNMLISFRFLF